MSEVNKDVIDLVWGRPSGGGVSTSIFRRWSQGFVFSEYEQTALEQFEGGPCAVIAPVQAFLLKNILFSRESSNWRQLSEEEQRTALCSTLSEILESACAGPTSGFCLVTWAKGQSPKTSVLSKSLTASQTQDSSEAESSQPQQEPEPTALAAEDLGFEQFHSALHQRTVLSVADLREEVLSLHHSWRGCCGVLLFLYSVIITKGIENIRNEIQDPTEPLIDPIHGHGSQSLVNLLVTGHAVSNVWDGDRECSGMKLHGVHKQASVGFLTLMESLRYCKVQTLPCASCFILPANTELSLVGPESPSEQARRVFQSFDPEDNGFIPDSLLEDVMKALDLVSEPEYVGLVRNKLDPESLGIILLGPFLLEFFPDQVCVSGNTLPPQRNYPSISQLDPHTHTHTHTHSDTRGISYVEGTALVLGFEDPMVRTDDTPVKRCLQTKWPYIELLWTTNRSPSLN
ncbi:family with sequence similarity 188 member A [Nothobranchius furzeri]|uniref:Ubiquitin carboxyl-terminal hydrolase MINDY n=1 Tax=Nothobranchius furzeri TaxID=105023 RepID=A0A9D2YW00_NOTFU|nr:family with sequence similarity 188 member A [Nothobranchius furzeri]